MHWWIIHNNFSEENKHMKRSIKQVNLSVMLNLGTIFEYLNVSWNAHQRHSDLTHLNICICSLHASSDLGRVVFGNWCPVQEFSVTRTALLFQLKSINHEGWTSFCQRCHRNESQRSSRAPSVPPGRSGTLALSRSETLKSMFQRAGTDSQQSRD